MKNLGTIDSSNVAEKPPSPTGTGKYPVIDVNVSKLCVIYNAGISNMMFLLPFSPWESTDKI